MSGQIFDQADLRSSKARRFAEAFAGCGEWVEPPPRRRRTSSGPFDSDAIVGGSTFRTDEALRHGRYRPAA